VEEKRAAATCLNVGGWWVGGKWWVVDGGAGGSPNSYYYYYCYNYYTSFLGNNLNWIRIMSKQSELDSDYFRLPEDFFSGCPKKSELHP